MTRTLTKNSIIQLVFGDDVLSKVQPLRMQHSRFGEEVFISLYFFTNSTKKLGIKRDIVER